MAFIKMRIFIHRIVRTFSSGAASRRRNFNNPNGEIDELENSSIDDGLQLLVCVLVINYNRFHWDESY